MGCYLCQNDYDNVHMVCIHIHITVDWTQRRYANVKRSLIKHHVGLCFTCKTEFTLAPLGLYTTTSFILFIIIAEINWAIAPQTNKLERRDLRFNCNLWPLIAFFETTRYGNLKVTLLTLAYLLWTGLDYWTTGLLDWTLTWPQNKMIVIINHYRVF